MWKLRTISHLLLSGRTVLEAASSELGIILRLISTCGYCDRTFDFNPICLEKRLGKIKKNIVFPEISRVEKKKFF